MPRIERASGISRRQLLVRGGGAVVAAGLGATAVSPASRGAEVADAG